jgi:DNA-binding NarL/FixJ family response regulator
MSAAGGDGDHGGMADALDTPDSERPLRIVVADDHPALRAGLRGLLIGERDLECVATVASVGELDDALCATRPDVVLLDYALGSDDGLSACFRIKQRQDPPGVVLYSAYVDDVFAVPAAMAQADATVSKTAEAAELLATVRRVGQGRSDRPALDAEMLAAASARLCAEDLPIASMLFSATPVADIADVLDLSISDVKARALRIIGRLQAGSRLLGRRRELELPA